MVMIIKGIIIIVVLLICITISASVYFFRYAVCRPPQPIDVRNQKTWKPHLDIVMRGRKWVEEHMEGLREIISRDGLKLKAIYIPKKGAKGIAVCMHGFHSNADVDFMQEVEFLWSLGYEILLPYQRGHGKSEGKYITYGAMERYDCKQWLEYANEELGAKGKNIFLCGISMGSATVMMASGLELPENVRGIIADCGFTSPWNIIKYVAREDFHVYKFPLLYIVNVVSQIMAGFNFKSVSSTEALKKNKIPVLFIHGDQDTYVPVDMTYKNFEACGSPKELYIVHGAPHATSFLMDMEMGKKKIGDFVRNYEKE